MCFARNEKAARAKLTERIASNSDHVKVDIEEVAAFNGFAMPKDTSIFKQADFVRG